MQTAASVWLVPEGGQETLSIILLSCRLYELSVECQRCCNVLFMSNSSVCVRLCVRVCVWERKEAEAQVVFAFVRSVASANDCVKSRVGRSATVLSPELKTPSSSIGLVSGGNIRGISVPRRPAEWLCGTA